MPAQPQWLLRLPQIIAEVERLPAPIVDRAVFEKIFRVRRRRAIQLMHQFAGHQSGRTFFIDRHLLLDGLRAKLGGTAFEYEQARRTKVVDELDRLRKLTPGRQIRIAVQPEIRDHRLADLPAGTHLSPGEFRLEFDGVEDLLHRLFEFSQAILNDYDRFRQIIENSELSQVAGR